MRKPLVVTLAAVAIGVVALSPAASAGTCTGTGCSLGTTAQVVVGAGSLTLDVSSSGATVNLTASGPTAILPGAAVTGSLGTTSVSDTRGSSTGWTASIAATDFADGASHTIPASAATVTPGTVGGVALPTTCGVGGVVTLPLTPIALSGSAAQLARCASLVPNAVIGASSVQWSNSISLIVPNNAVAGTYTSTVTQSVQ